MRLCVLDVDGLRDRILEEARRSLYLIHPGSTKMYHDLREIYWWEGLKRDIEEFVAKCPNCQQVKAKLQKSGGLIQAIQIPTWKWEDINMDFVVGLTWTQRSYDSIWFVVDRLGVWLDSSPYGVAIVHHNSELSLVVQVKTK